MVTPDQPVAETATSTPAVDVSVYEQQIQALKLRANEAEDKFQGIKGKLDDVYKKTRRSTQKNA